MSLESLKVLRILVPGIMMFIYSSFFFHESFDLSEILNSIKHTDGIIYTVIVFGLGGLYSIFNIRYVALQTSLSTIQQNIKNKLIKPYIGNKKINKHLTILTNGDILLRIFYKLIDSDGSLKEKAKNVYFNGILWSSSGDLVVISLVYSLIYIVAWDIKRSSTHFLFISIILYTLAMLIKVVILPIVTKKHLKLSNDQLSYICCYMRDDLDKLIYKSIKND